MELRGIGYLKTPCLFNDKNGRVQSYSAPSPPAPIIKLTELPGVRPRAKAALLTILGVVITVFLTKLANYVMRNQQVAAEPAGPATVQLPRPPPADLVEIDLELSAVFPAGN
jgi:hypothetical protein